MLFPNSHPIPNIFTIPALQVKSLTVADWGDVLLTVRDPTGEMQATMHRTLNYPSNFSMHLPFEYFYRLHGRRAADPRSNDLPIVLTE